MPDLDRIERTLSPEWRPPYKLLKGRQPIEEIGRAILQALAKGLREGGGAPGIPACAEAIQRHDNGLLDERSLAEVASRLERQMTSRNDKLLAMAVLRPAVSGPSSVLRGPADERLSLELLDRILENKFFSQMPYLVGSRFRSLEEAIQFENEVRCLLGPELMQLARRLARAPSATSLKAPPIHGAERRTTEQLLHEPL